MNEPNTLKPLFEIPTYDGITKEWGYTNFYTLEEFKVFVLSCFKEPGQYDFDETTLVFNEQSIMFQKRKFFCDKPFMSRDFLKYWDTQKERCRRGAIFKGTRGQTWYLTRDYYMLLNFMQIMNKEKQGIMGTEEDGSFMDVRDAQYHMALYELLAELHYEHAVVLKKRQIASSIFHAAKLINQIWFERGATCKMGASDWDFIGEEGTWKMLNQFRSFLNEHTAWYRPFQPEGVGMWTQGIEVTINGRKTTQGLMSNLIGITLDKSPTKGVGGAVKYFFYEEGGIAPTADKTYEFIRPALQSGMITVGMFVLAGSVGDLKQCGPLKKFLLKPKANGFYGVMTNLLNAKGESRMCGLFIPEQWSMLPFIDKFGNSDVTGSLAAIIAERLQWLVDGLTPDQYQLRVSQKPINIEEAFAYREESPFPQHLVSAQIQRIEDNEYPEEYVDLEKNDKGKVVSKRSHKLPILDFPVDPAMKDKEGVIVVYEKPDTDISWGTYFASIDPVSEGKAEYVGNLLYTPEGRKRIGDIKPGDFVIGSDGESTRVNAIFPQGKKDLYRVTFNDGASVLVCENHLWCLRQNGGERKDAHVLSTKQLMDITGTISFNGIGINKNKKYNISSYYKKNNGALRWRIPVTKAIKFNSRPLTIDPYLLGALLGDGGISTRSIRFSTIDTEMIGYISETLPSDITVKKIKNTLCDYRVSTSKSRNSVTKQLRQLKVHGLKSDTKFIPDNYKYASITDRLQLLRGLMDTDGYCGNHGAEYYSISKTLAYDVVELVQSLGGIAKIRKKIISETNVFKGKGHCYVVRVLLPDGQIPFRLNRKAKIHYKPKIFSRYIKEICYEKTDEAVCISVEAKDSLYVTEHAIVTHNTTTSNSLCSIIVYKNPVEVTKIVKDENGEDKYETYIEGDKIVCEWTGRFDDINKTHERLMLIIQWYQAWTLVEANVGLFFTYMTLKKMTHFLVPSDQMIFNKEVGNSSTPNHPFGWKNVGTIFKTHLLSAGIEWLSEELSWDTLPNGDRTDIKYGIRRIPSKMLMKEMQAYYPGLNVDRLITYCSLIAFAKIQQAIRSITKKVETTKKLENNKLFSKLKYTPFSSLGRNRIQEGSTKISRSPFKNMR